MYFIGTFFVFVSFIGISVMQYFDNKKQKELRLRKKKDEKEEEKLNKFRME